MVEFDLFPKQGESIAGLSLWFQKTLIGLGGSGVLKDLELSRVSSSSVTISSGYYSYYGVAAAHVGSTLSAIPVASAGMHRYDVIVLNGLTATIERLSGTEAIPDNGSNFLENYTPLPAPLTQPYYIVLGILWIDETGIKNSTKGTYCTSGIASMRSPASFGVDNSTILISAEGIISLATGYLKAAGTTPLTADWDVGAYKITANQLGSDVAIGTAPLVITSTTKVDNLNVDQVDGIHGTAMLLADGTTPLTGTWDAGSFQIRALTLYADVASGTPPLVITSPTLVANLNADLLDGIEGSAFLKKDGTVALTADWDVGSYKVTALTFASDQSTGTAPFTVASTTKVTSLNADQVDGVDIPSISGKGVLLVGSATSTLNALAVGGTNGQVLMVASGETTGLKWADHGDIYGLGDDDHTQYALRSLLTARGDIPYRGASVWEKRTLGSYGQILKSDGVDPVWGTLSGGINYITNYDAGADTSGWDEYADAAGVAPIDGTGGDHTDVTWTRSTSTPLRGVASFLLAKAASDQQGHGVGYHFIIDPADRASMLTLSFNWLSDVTLLEGDLVVYIAELLDADDTLVSLIQPTPYQLPGTVASVNNSWSAQFQTGPTNTHYRLIIHIASTSATAWNIKFDQFACGPSVMKQGVPVTDWEEKTFTGTWSANTTYKGFVKRVGDYAFFQVEVATSGAPTSETLVINLPSGYTIDTTKLPSATQSISQIPGNASLYDGGTKLYTSSSIVYYSSTAIQPMYDDGSSGSIAITQAAPFTFANTDKVTVFFRVPILGWSSNCQVSNDAETRVFAASYYVGAGSANLSIADNAVEILDAEVKISDTHGAVTVGATWKYTAPISGYYVVMFNSPRFTSNINITEFYIEVYKNNAVLSPKRILSWMEGTAAADVLIGGGCAPIYLNAGDYIDLRIYQNNSDNDARTLYSAATGHNIISVFRISGPSQIAANEKIVARYSTNAGQSIANGATPIVDFEDKSIDTHGCVTVGASWKFTAPRHDFYKVNAKMLFAANLAWAANSFAHPILRVSRAGGAAATYCIGHNYKSDSANTNTVHGVSLILNDIIELNAGDYICIQLVHGESSARALINSGDYNYISISTS